MQFVKVVSPHHRFIASAFQRQLTTRTAPIVYQNLNLTGIRLAPKLTSCSYSTADNGFFQTFKKMVGIGMMSKSVARSSGFKLYESVTNQVDYNEYFQALNMPDTFYSWFLVTEVHVWMLMARVMNEGENGRWVRNAIVEAMWQDVEYRSKQLGETSSSLRRKQIQELADQFQACLFSYDEGLMSSDHVMAGALWRNLLQNEDVEDLAIVDKLVGHVRQQMSLLDQVDPEVLLIGSGTFSWTKLNF